MSDAIEPTHRVVRFGQVVLTGSYVVCTQEQRANGGIVEEIKAHHGDAQWKGLRAPEG